ncbi:hypothetical protein GCM10027073_43960 [Streptomyces chlorus]
MSGEVIRRPPARSGPAVRGVARERLDPASPVFLGRVPGGAPRAVRGLVAPQHHGVRAAPAEAREPLLGGGQQRRGDALPAVVRVYREAVQVAAPAVESWLLTNIPLPASTVA